MIPLVIQSFGNENQYTRAVFTVLSYFAHAGIQASRVLLYTDSPDFFERYLDRLPVNYISLSSADLQRMRGNVDFLHRIKIAVIENAFTLGGEGVLYADSDTFFVHTPSGLLAKLHSGCAFMHKHEYQFEQLRSSPLPAGAIDRAVVNFIDRGYILLSDGSRLPVSGKLSSWNAGVMILPASYAALLPDVYSLTEQFYFATKSHASEQYAFSIVLQTHGELTPCDDVSYHYWYRVEKKIVDAFLTERLNAAWAKLPVEVKLQDVLQWTQYLPKEITSHIWLLRDRAVQAFNENNFSGGYMFAFRAVIKCPWNIQFLRDVAYHTRRFFKITK